MPSTRRLQLSCSVDPLDLSDGALLAAYRVRDKLSNGFVKGWRSVDGVSSVEGCLQLTGYLDAVDLQEAQARIEHCLRDLLRSQDAAFDVLVSGVATVEHIVPAITFQI